MKTACDDLCPKCRYELPGLIDKIFRCPECGCDIAHEQRERVRRLGSVDAVARKKQRHTAFRAFFLVPPFALILAWVEILSKRPNPDPIFAVAILTTILIGSYILLVYAMSRDAEPLSFRRLAARAVLAISATIAWFVVATIFGFLIARLIVPPTGLFKL